MAAPEPGHRSIHTGPERPATLEGWTITVDGLVSEPRSFTLEDLGALPWQVDLHPDANCPEGIGTAGATYGGVPLVALLGQLGPRQEGSYVTVEAGPFRASFTREGLEAQSAILAVLRNGKPMGWEDGGPVRLVVANGACFDSVKWVQRLTIEEHASAETTLSIVRARRGLDASAGTPANS